MSTNPSLAPAFASLRSRSLGAKFFLVLLLASLMSLAGFFVESLTTERADRHAVVAASSAPASQQPDTVLGIRLADSYRAIHRSLHYITLFLGLVFLTYFLFEVLAGKSLHPAQYALVGIAQTVFYLLLLSLSEHLGFDRAFLLAGAATVALLSCNAEWVFRSRTLAVRALVVFALLYTFVFILLRVEAYALLVGALTSFAAITAAMYVTRDVDWYGTAAPSPGFAAVPPTPGAGSRDSWLE